MYTAFIVLIGLLIFEGINALPTSQLKMYDLKYVGSSNSKYGINGRRMIHGKSHKYENGPVESKYLDNKPVEGKSEENKSEENKHDENKAVENKSDENKAVENKSDENKAVENKTEEKKSTEKTVDKSLENVISAIDHGVKTFINSDNKTAIISNLTTGLVELVKDNRKRSVFRSKAEEYLKPELIHFRNDPDGKPSVMLELNSQSIVNGLRDLLHSKLMIQLMDHYSKEAAVAYRSLKYEINKRSNRNN